MNSIKFTIDMNSICGLLLLGYFISGITSGYIGSKLPAFGAGGVYSAGVVGNYAGGLSGGQAVDKLSTDHGFQFYSAKLGISPYGGGKQYGHEAEGSSGLGSYGGSFEGGHSSFGGAGEITGLEGHESLGTAEHPQFGESSFGSAEESKLIHQHTFGEHDLGQHSFGDAGKSIGDEYAKYKFGSSESAYGGGKEGQFDQSGLSDGYKVEEDDSALLNVHADLKVEGDDYGHLFKPAQADYSNLFKSGDNSKEVDHSALIKAGSEETHQSFGEPQHVFEHQGASQDHSGLLDSFGGHSVDGQDFGSKFEAQGKSGGFTSGYQSYVTHKGHDDFSHL